jgi:hypothetical protein
MNKHIIIAALVCWIPYLNGKILIFTHSFSRPDFITLQDKTFKAFLEDDDYEFIIFNDASNPSICTQIERTCDNLNLRCIRIPQNIHHRPSDPGARHIDGIQFALNTVMFNHDDIAFMIDSDMFLFKPFSIRKYVGSSDLIGQEQDRSNGSVSVRYMAPLLVFMNMKTLPNKRSLNFDGGHIHGLPCDVGGHIYYYLKENPNANIRFIPAYCVAEVAKKSFDELLSLGLDDTTINWIKSLEKHFDASDPHRLQFHGDNHFMHYVAGGCNWNNRSQAYHEKKSRLVNSFIDEMIKKYPKN